MVIGTSLGPVIVTGDYKFDHTPIDGRITDVNTFAQLGQNGVLALLADSTNAETLGSTPSEALVGQAFHQIFAEAEGRVIVACFASHIHRVQQAIQIAHLHGRKFAVSGRSMQKNVNIAKGLGLLNVPEGSMIKLADIDEYRPEEILVLATGSQGEPLSALTRMAFDDHPQVGLHEGDTVVISATPDPRQRGQRHDHREPPAQGRRHGRLRQGERRARVGSRRPGRHAHDAQPRAAAVVRAAPRRVPAPVHPRRPGPPGRAWATSRSSSSRTATCWRSSEDNAEIVDKVHTGMVFVDGYEIGEAGGLVLRDRQQLAGDGILIAVVTIDAQSGDTVAPPELVARGFLHDDDKLNDVLDECAAALDDLMEELGKVHVTGQRLIKEDIKEKLSELVYSRTRRRPLIMPVVVEV